MLRLAAGTHSTTVTVKASVQIAVLNLAEPTVDIQLHLIITKLPAVRVVKRVLCSIRNANRVLHSNAIHGNAQQKRPMFFLSHAMAMEDRLAVATGEPI